MAPAELLLLLLRGRWAITRRITPGGHFEGAASFVPVDGTSLAYHEAGRMTLDGGGVLEAGNTAVYAIRNGVVAISFGPRPGRNGGEGPGRDAHFIDIALAENWPAALPAASTDRHICGADTYDAVFRLETWDRFTMTYLVHGPAKRYDSHATFQRASP